MTPIVDIGAHVKSEANFDKLLTELGLEFLGPDGEHLYDYATHTGRFMASEPIYIAVSYHDPKQGYLPGVYYNIRLMGDLATGKAVDDLTIGSVATKGDIDNINLPAGRDLTWGRVYNTDFATIKTPALVWA